MPTIDPTTPAGTAPSINASTASVIGTAFTLKMSDEFNSTTVDSKWQLFVDYGNLGAPASNQWDVNSGGNSLFRIIPVAGYPRFTMRTLGSNPFRTRYGYFEARIQQSRGKGYFPSFWLFDDASQQELDIYECFSYDNGDTWTDGQAGGWHPTDAQLHQWNYGGSIQQTPSDDLAMRRLRYPPPRGDSLPSMRLNEAFHTYAMYWSPSVIYFIFDGEIIGNPLTPTPQLSSGNNVQFYVLFDQWWGLSGNPTPDATNTPTGTSNAMMIDWVRIYDIGGSPTPPPPPPPGPTPPPPPPSPPPLSATLDQAPNDGATVSGNVVFLISGDSIANAELLPGTAGTYTPKYGTFTLSPGPVGGPSVLGRLDWDTTALTNGSYYVRISVFDAPPGGTGSELVIMTRTFIINNLTPTPSIPDPDMEFFSSSVEWPRRWRIG